MQVFPGNNSRVILSTLKIRSWWHGILSADDDTLANASPTLVWEMYRSAKRYKEKAYDGTLTLNLTNPNSYS